MAHYFTEKYQAGQTSDVRYFSDLHLEFDHDFSISDLQPEQIVVLAGDIFAQGRGKTLNKLFLNFVLPILAQGNQVVYVTGNHEYYGSRIDKVHRFLEAFAKEHANFHFLNNSSVFINDIEFLGGTLWTSLDNSNPLVYLSVGSRNRARDIISHDAMREYRAVSVNHRGTYRKLQTLDTILYHQATVSYIRSRIGKHPKQIVVTHHTPSDEFICSRVDSPIGRYAYFSELDELAQHFDAWVAGHTHKKVKKKVGGTWYLSNPRGYISEKEPNEAVKGFDPHEIFTL
jgi:predicted phosphodiesterase